MLISRTPLWGGHLQRERLPQPVQPFFLVELHALTRRSSPTAPKNRINARRKVPGGMGDILCLDRRHRISTEYAQDGEKKKKGRRGASWVCVRTRPSVGRLRCCAKHCSAVSVVSDARPPNLCPRPTTTFSRRQNLTVRGGVDDAVLYPSNMINAFPPRWRRDATKAASTARSPMLHYACVHSSQHTKRRRRRGSIRQRRAFHMSSLRT
ncbi:hypothetical protein BS50DRAFT_101980 [Corynespora cassiicola Philippines]|uniref:Uncharacterized protein n=1 Tax=Corynespora cassiicola Philippines TaxID=1448308 RepID=A0A2T2NC22_CORCC|nr:hypothetical protein BS50DRAFT_101980 [Corynespora cassiicola Philippines]